jgi:hypothetical protein
MLPQRLSAIRDHPARSSPTEPDAGGNGNCRQAEQLRQIAADEELEPDSGERYTDEKQVGMALGHSPPKDGATIVQMWWD